MLWLLEKTWLRPTSDAASDSPAYKKSKALGRACGASFAFGAPVQSISQSPNQPINHKSHRGQAAVEAITAVARLTKSISQSTNIIYIHTDTHTHTQICIYTYNNTKNRTGDERLLEAVEVEGACRLGAGEERAGPAACHAWM
jgi:hypothetical protein